MNLTVAEALAARFEGFRSRPYLCPAGYPTIGYGSRFYLDGREVSLSDPPISEPEARALLAAELLGKYAPAVRRLCPGLVPLALLSDDWGAFCAIVDFAYNLGTGALQASTLRRKINACDWVGARSELARWIIGGGRPLLGLVARRSAEASYLPN